MMKYLLVYSAMCLLAGACSTVSEQSQSNEGSIAMQQAAALRMTIGVRTIPIAQALSSGLKTSAPSGLYVVAVDAGHPAARAGIRRGDVLLACGAKPLDDYDDLRTVLDATELGSTIVFTIWRGGIERKLLVKPEVAKPAT